MSGHYITKLGDTKRVILEQKPGDDFRAIHIEVGVHPVGYIVARLWTDCEQTQKQEVCLSDEVLPHLRTLIDKRLTQLEASR